MSSSAGIAAVTAVLKDLLLNGLIDHDVGLGNVIVTAQAPDRIKLPEENSQLNLFLYLVSPNSGWRNVGYPTRDSEGSLVNSAPLALDLHYLLSAYATRDFHSEILLGYAMQLMHEMPVLTREAIHKALSPALQVNGAGQIPAELQDLFKSGLADQIEQIKITPSYLSTEEMFKLWMAFQTPYRPTAAYHVSVVLIDSKRKGKVAPPVRDRQFHAIPFVQPVIDQVLSQSAPDQPFLAQQRVLANFRLAVIGRNLQSSDTRIQMGNQEVAIAAADMTATRVEFNIPANLLAGVHALRVAHWANYGNPPTPHASVESNVAALVLSPRLSNLQVVVTEGQGAPATTPRSGNITADIQPDVGKKQEVTLLLNEFEPPMIRSPRAYRFAGTSHRQPNSPPTSAAVAFPFAGVLPGTYIVRVHVDGAESPLEVNAAGNFAQPQLVVP